MGPLLPSKPHGDASLGTGSSGAQSPSLRKPHFLLLEPWFKRSGL